MSISSNNVEMKSFREGVKETKSDGPDLRTPLVTSQGNQPAASPKDVSFTERRRKILEKFMTPQAKREREKLLEEQVSSPPSYTNNLSSPSPF